MNVLRTVFLMTLLTLILVFVGRIVAGPTGMILALAIGLVFQFVNYWFSSKIVLAVYGARILEPGEMPQLQADVQDLADKAGLPMPKVAIVPKEAPNAFATGRSPSTAVVAVTEGLLKLCDRRQVKAILGHEMGHVRNHDMLTMTLVAGIASTIGMLAYMAQWAAIFGGGSRDRDRGGNAIAMLLIAILAPLMAMLVQMAISRSREYAADAASADIAQDPGALADALEKLHRATPSYPPLSATGATAHMMISNPFAGRGEWFSTHPSAEKRIARLREMAAGRR